MQGLAQSLPTTSTRKQPLATLATVLTPQLFSQPSFKKGSTVSGNGAIGSEAGQALSATSNNNFINFCSGKTLTNGLQVTTGSCNGIAMGDIPAKTAMVSSVITFPTTNGKAIDADTDFNITVQTANLVAGSFTDADTTYYSAPQALQNGQVVGHTHVTVQDMGSNLNPTTPLDATQFAFFKGINDAGNGKGLLTATVAGGLPAGNYRVCTMTSSSNHQPVLMPVAQRGTQDDCTKFVVSGSGNTANVASNDGSTGEAAAAAAAAAVSAGPGLTTGAVTAAAAAATSASTSAAASAAKAASTGTSNTNTGKNANGGNAGKNGNTGKNANAGNAGKGAGGRGGKDRKQRFARRKFIA